MCWTGLPVLSRVGGREAACVQVSREVGEGMWTGELSGVVVGGVVSALEGDKCV